MEPEEVVRVVACHDEFLVDPSGELMVELADQTAALALVQALSLSSGEEVLPTP
ncbi:hypothetical protein DFAR_3800022 [Desulfarculales bacterium]